MAKQKRTVISSEVNQIDLSKYIVPVEKLRWVCPEENFNFESTDDLEPLNEIVGQKRAIEAIKLGAELNAKGFNIFVTGLSGTGRTSTVKQILEANSSSCPELFDYCYVNNFEYQDKPTLLVLKKGLGKKFSQTMKDVVSFLKRRIQKLFDEEAYQTSRKKIIDNFQKKEHDVLYEFDKKIKPFGLIRGQLENEQGYIQPEVFPLIDGKAVQIEDIEGLVQENKLNQEQADEIYINWQKFHDEIFDLAKVGMKLMQEFRKELAEHDMKAADIVVNSTLSEVKSIFHSKKVDAYIDNVKKYILTNLNIFVPANPSANQAGDINHQEEEEAFRVFDVNVICDNSNTISAPVVIETSPTYTNLFGTIEKTYDKRGFWKTDFTMIKAGSLLNAAQGFLLVNADDLFQEQGVWLALKRVLLYDKLEIQPYDSYFQISQSAIKPEPIEIHVKVIIIGGQTLYKGLYAYEKGFKKIFKINAQFDYEFEKNEEMIINFAKFASKLSKDENIPACDKSGVAALTEWAVEHSGTQKKISLKFSDAADILREAAYYVSKNSSKYITRKYIEEAISSQRFRNNLVDEKLKEQIMDGDMMISTQGKRVGMINGLTIYDNGILSFGKPARISANIGAGTNGIINIEREADMSGKIHNKGVLLISGFLRERFAQKRVLSLAASIAFEQNYGGIDGDSATAAEIFVILSALTGIPIKQSLAITGSSNQKGEIQPIGGVNEKLIGFYEICKVRGFDGTHGCIIPAQNVKDLMLPYNLIEDVKKGNFTIYAIKQIEDGIEILFEMKAGAADKDYNYPENTLFGLADNRLTEYSKIIKPVRDNKKQSIIQTDNIHD
jgi:ATP-dependent Lon protease